MSKKNFILITGGAGYIGSVVANYLIDRGYKIIIFDDLSTGSLKLINKKAIFFKCDIKNYKALFKKIKNFKNKISTIFHFAASLSVEESQKNPLKYYNNNVLGTENILKIGVFLKIKKFIFSSTCAVYGDQNKKYISESSTTLPISNYGKTKLFAEKLVQEYCAKYNVKFSILRYFNVIGAEIKNRSGPISGKTIFKVLCENSTKKNFTIDLYGNDYDTKDGSCIRDYIDVNDLAELHILSESRLNQNKSFILNCGYGKGYSVKQIIEAFSAVLNNLFYINIKKRREGDMKVVCCDTKNLKKMFPSWIRKSTLKQSIARAINWEKKLML